MIAEKWEVVIFRILDLECPDFVEDDLYVYAHMQIL